MSILALMVAAAMRSPIPTPPVFDAGSYALTFRSPPHTWICPLPDDWTGSNHGTIIFLVAPNACGGVGYPSSSRGFDGDPPRIEVFYAYWSRADDGPWPGSHCPGRVAGQIYFAGRHRRLCEERHGGILSLWTYAPYRADTSAEVSVNLVTTPKRRDTDFKVFKAMVATVRPCLVTDTGGPKPQVFGQGAPCPKEGRFF